MVNFITNQMEVNSVSTVLNSEPSVEMQDETTDKINEIPIIVKDDEASSARLLIEGLDDENEEVLSMTIEEIQKFILAEVEANLKNKDINPLIAFKDNQETYLHEELQRKKADLDNMRRCFHSMLRDQVKLLKHLGVIKQSQTRTVGVSVDLPWLPESIPVSDDILKTEGNKNFLQSPNGAASKLTKKESSGGPIECIDLTDDDVSDQQSSSSTVDASTTKPIVTPLKSESISSSTSSTTQNSTSTSKNILTHPAPLPTFTPHCNESEILPKPQLQICVDNVGIVLQWDLPPEAKRKQIAGYEIIGYQERSDMPISSALWKKIGRVEQMTLPMSCTLTQFVENFKYHFSIRAVSKDNVFGHYSDPGSVKFMHVTKKD